VLLRPKKIDYTSPASAQGGPGVSKQITWYVGTPYVDMTAAVFTGVQQAIGASLGDMWWLGGQGAASGGNAFMFVKATVGLTLGQLVAPALPTTGTITVPGSPVTTVNAVTTNISNATAGVNGEVDNWFWGTITGAALPQIRRIKANTAAATGNFTFAQPDFLRPNSPFDKDALDTTPTNGDVCSIIRPYQVIVSTATTIPIGVALGTVTAGNFTIVQVAGLAAVLANGSGVALVANEPAAPAAAGAMAGFAGTATALVGRCAPQFGMGGMLLPQIATAAAALVIPAYVNFTGK
jgi:hypothetical protein